VNAHPEKVPIPAGDQVSLETQRTLEVWKMRNNYDVARASLPERCFFTGWIFLKADHTD
jgi:hypothetical protein